MALVFKIKHEETLRRWVVAESVNAEMFPVTLEQLQVKVRELFQFPPTAPLGITYVDKENDLVTLGDDRDLMEACLVQRLNPLRLEVQVLESKPDAPNNAHHASKPADDLNVEGFLKCLFPNVTPEALQGFLQMYAQLLDPSLPIATLLLKAQDAFKEFLAHAATPEFQTPGPSDKPAHHHPFKHPCAEMHCKSMPNRGEHSSAMDASSCPGVHSGVQCDGCGTTPIQGPRYKSKKILDFDLCSACYEEKGNEGDYDKIEYPAYFPPSQYHYYCPPFLSKEFNGPSMCGRGSFSRGPYGWRSECAFAHDEHRKLDACFMKDITIFEGTELAPSTKFTKIWRMCNNGSLPWPQNTQLLCIGGDVLSLQEAAKLELPESGLACGEEVEVSVDLKAPEKPGRYISHWCLASPVGRKFGQRVSVTIQVVSQGEQSPMLDESLKEGQEKGNIVKNVSSLVGVPIISPVKAENEPILKIEKMDEMMAEGPSGPTSRDVADVKTTENAPAVSQELEGFSLVEMPENGGDKDMTDNVEKELKLQSLESMGFMDGELNAVLLSKNHGNVQHTVDDLLVAARWDGALEDLQEMGFTERATNVRLLMKHEGSIKAAVRDLLHRRKQEA